jgi:hypothetical protein
LQFLISIVGILFELSIYSTTSKNMLVQNTICWRKEYV